MAVVTMREMLDSGVHFGHQTRRWNPKMKRFIFTERNGIYIIDLQQTLSYIDKAFEFVKETVAHGGTVLFVGTKRQAQEPIADQATRVGMPYVNHRWLGGMLTNFQTVHTRIQRLKELESMEQNGWEGTATKKEQLILTREMGKLQKTLGGIREMARVPSAVWIVDTKKEHIAVGEARKLNIPVIAILDTNCDPDEVDYKIPGNDDAIRSAALLTRVIADAVAEGLIQRAAASANAGRDAGDERGRVGTGEPLADWERALLETGTQPSTAASADEQPPAGAASTAPAAVVAASADDDSVTAGTAATPGAGVEAGTPNSATTTDDDPGSTTVTADAIVLADTSRAGNSSVDVVSVDSAEATLPALDPASAKAPTPGA